LAQAILAQVISAQAISFDFASVGGGAVLPHMRAIQTCDDELLSDSSGMTVQERQQVSWRKPLAVSTCVALVVAAIVSFKRIPAGLGEVAQKELINFAEGDDCSSDSENCMETRCCKVKGRKCFVKNEYWANCNEDCDTSFIDDWDKQHNITEGWNCSVLEPLPKDACAKDHVDCGGAGGKCCSEDHICYIKNEWWRNCNKGCEMGAGANDYEHSDKKADSWSCEIHDLGATCSLAETASPEDLYTCCKTTFCKDPVTPADCNKTKCAFYVAALDTSATTTAAASPGA